MTVYLNSSTHFHYIEFEQGRAVPVTTVLAKYAADISAYESLTLTPNRQQLEGIQMIVDNTLPTIIHGLKALQTKEQLETPLATRALCAIGRWTLGTQGREQKADLIAQAEGILQRGQKAMGYQPNILEQFAPLSAIAKNLGVTVAYLGTLGWEYAQAGANQLMALRNEGLPPLANASSSAE